MFNDADATVLDINDFFDINKKNSKSKTRKERRAEKSRNIQSPGLVLKTIKPLTHSQQKVFDYYDKGKHVVLYGSAGTGKTFLALYLALKELKQNDSLKDIMIVRSAVASRDLGFMPGNKNEKMKVFESAYYGIFSELYGRGDAYENMKTKGIVKFEPTSFLRGVTIKNSIIILDEVQSMTWHEIQTVLTRVGENTKIMVCGDFRQNDLFKKSDGVSGFNNMIEVMEDMKSVAMVEFTQKDIVRSGFAKEFLISCENHNL